MNISPHSRNERFSSGALRGLLLAAALAAALSAGCAGARKGEEQDQAPIPASRDDIPLSGQNGGNSPALHENAARDAWLATTPWTEEPSLDTGARYNLAAREQDVRDVLLTFGHQSPYNFILAPEVEGPVTVDLRNVSLARALKAILDPLKLEYRMDGEFIWVQDREAESEMFALNYVVSERSGSMSASGTGLDTGRGRHDVGTTDMGGRGGIGGGGASVGSSMRFDVYAGLQDSLQLFLSDNGRLNINRESGVITVLDYRENVHKVSRYLDRIKDTLGRQVEIEAKVLEVILRRDREFGIDWNYIQGELGINFLERTADRVLTATLSSQQVSMVVRALRETRDVTVRTRPRIMAMNNQPALIVLGEEEVYFQTVDTLDPDTGRVVSSSTVPRSVTIGVSLTVMPHIGDDGEITMDVHPRISEKVGSKVAPDGTSVPELSVREVSTVARVRDGQSMIIGGLISERDMHSETGAPVLSSIPIVGSALFNTRRTERRQIELVIFLTPRIVR